MGQPALKQDGIPDEILRLAEELNAVSPLGSRFDAANRDHDASSLARRFAPDSFGRRGAAANPTVLPPAAPPSGTQDGGSRRFALSVAAGLLSATALVGGMLWLGGTGRLDLDRMFQGAGVISPMDPTLRATAALAIDVDPPRSSSPTVGDDGDGKDRTAARPEVAPPLSPGFAVRSGEVDRVDSLMAHGRKMIDVGYLAGARAYYRRAAEAGSGEAALAVGATYDPDIVARLGVQGIKPDRAEAAQWYARAAGLGITDREAALKRLTADWGKEPSAPAPTQVAAAAVAQGISAPLRKPHAEAAPPPRTATETESEPAQQRVASNNATAAVKPQLLAADKEPKPGPLSRFVQAAAGLTVQEEWMEVASPVNIRQGPSSDAHSDKVALKGTKFRVVGREGNWIRVSDPKTAQEGYIYSRFLKVSSAP